MKRYLGLLLALLLSLSLLAGCNTGNGNGGETATDAPQNTAAPTDNGGQNEDETTDSAWEPATYSIWTWPGAIENWGATDYNDVLAFQEAEKITNTKIEWVMQSDTQTFDLVMASGDLPDAIYYAWNPIRQGQYSEAGLIQDIRPYIESSAPDIKALIDSDPLVQKQLIREDGSIYLVPWLTTDPYLLAGEGPAIRKDWLDKFGLEVPRTPEELYQALKTFREQDANGNGEADEYITGYMTQIPKTAFAFGASDGDVFIYDADGKTVLYSPITEEYREWLRWMNTLYSENLIDADAFLNDSDLYMKKHMEDRVGFYVDNPNVLNRTVKDGAGIGLNIEWVPMQYMQKDGANLNFSTAMKRYVQPYGLVFSSTVENPERLMEWFNFWFTEEGSTLLNWGVEGVSYTGTGDSRAYTDAVLNDAELEPGVAFSQFGYATFVGVQSQKAAAALDNEFAVECRAAWAQIDTSRAMEPFLAFNADEQQINTQYAADLKTMKETWRDGFITGAKNIDTDWDAYVAEAKAYNCEALVKIYQDASDRYLAK